MKIKQLLAHIILCSLMISLYGCFGGGKNKDEPKDEEIIDDQELVLMDTEGSEEESFFDGSQPFYPLQETIDDIQLEMSELRAKILDYESRIKNQDNSLETLHKIQFPHLTHEIELTNGTLVNGNIIQENSDRMIVKTQIGQLTIDKVNVATIINL